MKIRIQWFLSSRFESTSICGKRDDLTMPTRLVIYIHLDLTSRLRIGRRNRAERGDVCVCGGERARETERQKERERERERESVRERERGRVIGFLTEA